jgi:thymidylate kinase
MTRSAPEQRQRGRTRLGRTDVPGTFIALEGPDGVGKSTLSARLGAIDYATAAANLDDRGADRTPLVFVSRRQVSATSDYSAKLMEQLATVLWHSGDAPDLPDAFWVAVQAAWFTAHAATVLEPLLAVGYDVIVDGWVYKFFSKLLLQGHTQHDLEVIFGRVRMPDAVVLLTADVGALYDRRSAQFRLAELGMHAGYPALGRATFVEYQQRGLDNLLTFAAQRSWSTVPLDPDATIEDSLAALAPLVDGLRAAAPPHRTSTQA